MKTQRQRPPRNLIAPLMFIAGAALAALGIARGEIGTLFKKAVAVCLECVGIG